MDTRQHERLRELFDHASQLPLAQRDAWLDEACAGDPALRDEVRALLVAADGAGSFLSMPVGVSASEPDTLAAGLRLGAWHVVRPIGRGGMGTVYLGVRADEHRKQVAIKVMTAAVGEEAARRFRRERQILARLEHPNIAHFIDTGTTPQGAPYVVIDYVDGVPIDQWCNQQGLAVAQRLRLFLRVCDAVAYAHRHLVVHRDLKPRNIMVTAGGQPQLLDFGIAKLLGDTDSFAPALTHTGLQPMTPEYASPEQARGEAVTTQSDVYSLGVVLYELLTGSRPYETSGRRFDEILRIVCEQAVTRPSTRVAAPASRVPRPEGREPAVAAAEGGAPRLRRRLEGDLDTIVLMALQKAPARRYSSVGRLADDIARHLDGLPVTARPDTVGYRMRKFAQRHTAAVAASLLLLVAVVGGAGATYWQARVAQRERAEALAQRGRAEQRFAEVRQLATSLLFDFHDAIVQLPGATQARGLVVGKAAQYLDSLSAEAAGDLALQEELATAYERLGDVQGNPSSANLGDAKAALVSYRKAEAIRQALSAARPDAAEVQARLASTSTKIGDALFGAGNVKDALAAYQQVRVAREKVAAAAPGDLANSRALAEATGRLCTALVAVGDLTGALENCARNFALLEQLVAKIPGDAALRAMAATNRIGTGNALRLSGKPREALAMIGEGITRLDPLVAAAPDNAELRRRTAVAWTYKANAQIALGDAGGGADSFARAVALLDVLVRADPANVRYRTDLSYMLNRQADLLVKAGRSPEARPVTLRALGMLGENATRSGASSEALNEYAWALVSCVPADLRQPERALQLAQRAVAAVPGNAVYLHTLAWGYYLTGNRSAAVAAAEKAVGALSGAPPGPAVGLRQQVENDLAAFKAGTAK